MRTRGIHWLALAICAITAPAAAQDAERGTPDGEPTRAERALAARQARAATSSPFSPGRVERLLTFVETSPVIRGILAQRDGIGVRLGGIESGSALAVGPAWRTSTLFHGALHAGASAAAALNGDREAEARLAWPHLGSRTSGHVEIAATTLAGEPFFGRGGASSRLDESAFRLDQQQVGTAVGVDATNWLRLSAGAALLNTQASDGRRRGVPAITARFSDNDAPALGRRVTLRVLSFGATVDRRDVPGNPRRGGRYHLGVSRYVDAADRNTFTRIDADVEHHLSAWKRQRVLTLRAIASGSLANDGREVPFSLQRTLGGSRLLRGFVSDRFRDRHLVVLQAEYGFDLLPFVNTVLFYETGAVAPRWHDLSLGNLRRDYGLGFRFGGARAVAFRTDVAFGSGEGTRLTMRFGHAF